MECVASEYVLDFELERPISAKNFKIFFTDKCKFFCSFICGYNSKTFVDSLQG